MSPLMAGVFVNTKHKGPSLRNLTSQKFFFGISIDLAEPIWIMKNLLQKI